MDFRGNICEKTAITLLPKLACRALLALPCLALPCLALPCLVRASNGHDKCVDVDAIWLVAVDALDYALCCEHAIYTLYQAPSDIFLCACSCCML